MDEDLFRKRYLAMRLEIIDNLDKLVIAKMEDPKMDLENQPTSYIPVKAAIAGALAELAFQYAPHTKEGMCLMKSLENSN